MLEGESYLKNNMLSEGRVSRGGLGEVLWGFEEVRWWWVHGGFWGCAWA